MPSRALRPSRCYFDGTGSYDPGTIVSYQWDFGDGTSSTSPTPSKTFTAIGDRVVTLRVTDNDGLIGMASRTISALALTPPQCAGPSGGISRQFWNGIGGTSMPIR
ncbi:MAG: PKD domain-containing protein [Flavobacteriales bacterium]|nr:PKD domain-containing protein [Flavobacteriales bacterium]